MDPGGTHRIVSQQIREWHVSRDADRQARLLEASGPAPAADRSPGIGRAWSSLVAGVVALGRRLRRQAV
jgi:hypothetical protein